MKVAFIYMGSKGASSDAYGMAMGLSHHSDLLCIISKNVDNLDLWEKAATINNNIKLLKIDVGNTIFSGMIGLLNICRFFKIINVVNEYAPNLVYSFMGHPWERMFVPYLKCQVTLSSIHDTEADHGVKDWRRSFFNLFNYKTKYYVTYSCYSKKELVKKGYDKNMIVVTPLACNDVIERKEGEVNVHKNNCFLFWGRIEAYKGLGVLLESVDKVFQDCPNAKLIIAGRGDLSPYRNQINRYSNNIEVYNEWIPNEKIEEFFNQTDFVVAPYIGASQSGVITLAFSYGKPVIVSDSGALPEQITEGRSGIVVPTGDNKALSYAIISILRDDKRLAMMKKNAYEQSQKMTWAASAKILLDFIIEKGFSE